MNDYSREYQQQQIIDLTFLVEKRDRELSALRQRILTLESECARADAAEKLRVDAEKRVLMLAAALSRQLSSSAFGHLNDAKDRLITAAREMKVFPSMGFLVVAKPSADKFGAALRELDELEKTQKEENNAGPTT